MSGDAEQEYFADGIVQDKEHDGAEREDRIDGAPPRLPVIAEPDERRVTQNADLGEWRKLGAETGGPAVNGKRTAGPDRRPARLGATQRAGG